MSKRKQESAPPLAPPPKRHEVDQGTIHFFDAVPDLEAIFEGKNDAALYEEASVAVETLLEAFVPALCVRSATRALAGKFADAQRDAELVILIAPSSAKGYLCKGKIYALEGRQAAAIRVFEKGLNKAASTDPDYDALKRALRAARMQSKKRVDFISMLPEEILTRIWSDLSGPEEYVYISKRWRDRLTQCPDPWRSISLYSSFSEHFTLLPWIGKHIETVEYWSRSRRQAMIFFDNLTSGKLNRLRQLKFTLGKSDATLKTYKKGINAIYAGSKLPPEQLSVALWSARHTLTDLTLQYDEGPVLPLVTVFHVCPNLLHLSYTAMDSLVEGVSESIPRSNRLESLSLCVKSIPAEELEAVLRWCPKLKTLTLLGCEPAALSLIDRMSPELKLLNFGVKGSAKMSTNQETQTGLQALFIRHNQDTRGEDVLALLEKSQKTLEYFGIGFPFNLTTGLQTWNSLGNLTFNALREAQFCFDSTVQPIVVNILKESPALESVTFGACDLASQVLDILAKLDKLRQLHIRRPSRISGLQRFFRKHVVLGAASSLRDVRLFGCPSIRDDVLATLAEISTLESIAIGNCHGLTVEGMNQFAEALSRLPQLKSLSFQDLSSVTDDALIKLADIENLTTLDLRSLPKITDAGICELVDDAIWLEDLDISDCKGVSYKASHEAWERVWRRSVAKSG